MIKINPIDYAAENFLTKKEAIRLTRKFQKEGKLVGLCTGSFDLLHPGHIAHLISAKEQCDILMVAMARNIYSQNKYPNSGRPVFPDKIRAYMVANLDCVDYVFLDYGTNKTIRDLRANVYVKGIDYADLKEPTIRIEKGLMESFGGKMIFTDTPKFSTTEIVDYVKEKIRGMDGKKYHVR